MYQTFCIRKKPSRWKSIKHTHTHTHKVTCRGYNEDGVGKTDRNLVTRKNESASREDKPMFSAPIEM